MFWINSKTGNQCVSVSTDGQMLWWDTRRLTEPTDNLLMSTDIKNNGQVRESCKGYIVRGCQGRGYLGCLELWICLCSVVVIFLIDCCITNICFSSYHTLQQH